MGVLEVKSAIKMWPQERQSEMDDCGGNFLPEYNRVIGCQVRRPKPITGTIQGKKVDHNLHIKSK